MALRPTARRQHTNRNIVTGARVLFTYSDTMHALLTVVVVVVVVVVVLLLLLYRIIRLRMIPHVTACGSYILTVLSLTQTQRL